MGHTPHRVAMGCEVDQRRPGACRPPVILFVVPYVGKSEHTGAKMAKAAGEPRRGDRRHEPVGAWAGKRNSKHSKCRNRAQAACREHAQRLVSRHRERDRLLMYAAQVDRNRERSLSATAAASGMAAISSAHLRLDVV